MAILLLTENFPPKVGGSCRYLFEIYRRLPKGQAVIVAGSHPGAETFDADHSIVVERLPLHFTSWGVSSSQARRTYSHAIRRLGQRIRGQGVNVIHCGRPMPEGLIALWLRFRFGVPFACHVHGEEMNYAAGSRELAFLMRRVLRHASYLIANSKNTIRILTQEWGVAADRIRLVYPGVDTTAFVPAPPSPALRDRLGWEGRSVILTVSRLQKRKGHDQMIRALPAIRQAIPNVLYAIVGDGEERAHLGELAEQEGVGGQVQFLGELDDAAILPCYQQCDLFVLPNRQVGQDVEGLGMVLLEAQACGKPVIAGNSGGTAETLVRGATGEVVDCTHPHDLASLVSTWLAQPEILQGMGRTAREFVVENFDWNVLGRKAAETFGLHPIKQPMTGNCQAQHVAANVA